MRIIPVLFFLSFINAQIALPTFQGVHKTHTTVVAESDSQTFSYTGAQQTLTISSGVDTVTIKAYGASGADSYKSSGHGIGGLGGYATGKLSVTSGQVLYVYVGGAGQVTTQGSQSGGGSSYIGGVSSSETIAGNASMPNPDGGTMTGRDGNGLVVISW